MPTARESLSQPILMAHATHPKQTLRPARRAFHGVWDNTTKACPFLDQ